MKTLIVFLGITVEKIKREYDRCYALTKIRNFQPDQQLEGVLNCKCSLDKKASYSNYLQKPSYRQRSLYLYGHNKYGWFLQIFHRRFLL